jgi:TrwC relaxase
VSGGVRLMMAVHVLHAGDGYTYLTRQVASGDHTRARGESLADYYTANGNPPGVWTGSGIARLDVEGTVSEAQMRALFGHGLHPDAQRLLPERVALYVAAGETPARAAAAAERDVRLGRPRAREALRPEGRRATVDRRDDHRGRDGRLHRPSPRADDRRRVVRRLAGGSLAPQAKDGAGLRVLDAYPRPAPLGGHGHDAGHPIRSRSWVSSMRASGLSAARTARRSTC